SAANRRASTDLPPPLFPITAIRMCVILPGAHWNEQGPRTIRPVAQVNIAALAICRAHPRRTRISEVIENHDVAASAQRRSWHTAPFAKEPPTWSAAGGRAGVTRRC